MPNYESKLWTLPRKHVLSAFQKAVFLPLTNGGSSLQKRWCWQLREVKTCPQICIFHMSHMEERLDLFPLV